MIDLDIRYESQWNVPENPTGSCNVTSLAMCLEAAGILGLRSDVGFPEELYLRCEELHLDRHYPADLAKLARWYGANDKFTTRAKADDIKNWMLDKQLPVMIHTYLTSAGHIIVLKGFDETGWIVDDPYGEYYSSGYDCREGEGDSERYSYDLIDRKASPEGRGHIWVHFITINNE